MIKQKKEGNKMKKIRKKLFLSICLLTTFAFWTILIRFIDVQAIGPNETSVGFATLNQFVHRLTGVNMFLYDITDWLSIIPLLIILGFAFLGLYQYFLQKSLKKIDYDILILGGFYIIVMIFYVFFEFVVINFRPVLINGNLEASYPSSTTMLVMCVIPTANMQFKSQIKHNLPRLCITTSLYIFMVFMVLLRLISGVHWFTDIIGGILLSSGLVMIYDVLLLVIKDKY